KIFARFDKEGEEKFIFPKLPDTWVQKTHSFEGDKFIISFKIIKDNELIGTLRLRAELIYLKTVIYDDIIAAAWILFAGLIAAVIIAYLFQRTISTRLLAIVA